MIYHWYFKIKIWNFHNDSKCHKCKRKNTQYNGLHLASSWPYSHYFFQENQEKSSYLIFLICIPAESVYVKYLIYLLAYLFKAVCTSQSYDFPWGTYPNCNDVLWICHFNKFQDLFIMKFIDFPWSRNRYQVQWFFMSCGDPAKSCQNRCGLCVCFV